MSLLWLAVVVEDPIVEDEVEGVAVVDVEEPPQATSIAVASTIDSTIADHVLILI